MSKLVSYRKKKISKDHIRILIVLLSAMMLITICLLLRSCALRSNKKDRADNGSAVENYEGSYATDCINVDLLTPNKYSRPGIRLPRINGIVVHYTANPGSTAKENRDYFDGLKDSHATHASSHFIVGIDGEIVQCIPTREVSYASNERNMDTISIECCHVRKDGRFTEKTYSSLVRLCAYLCHRFGLSQKDIIRHYDVTGKLCPRYFVEHKDAWAGFKADVKKALKSGDYELQIR